ncbi:MULTISPECIES: polysaccharide deacetylase [unclassified Pseudomonas]|uniref:polysaccharide deacetylase n=1 Tax=unclassified Pseudomonas TaxID=196821 RepID=UPI000A1DDF7C|nr:MULTISPECIES: polysaccharide deacetylase [unclassified Pseudomonas]
MQWLRMASILLLWLGACHPGIASDAGKALVLTNLERSGWPDALTSQANVDTASRAEVLMFAKALLASEALDEQGLKRRLEVPQVRLESIRRVRDGLWEGLLGTYRNASLNCDGQAFCPRVRNVADLRQLAAAFTGDISPAHALWASRSQGLHEQTVNEQLRVASLQP